MNKLVIGGAVLGALAIPTMASAHTAVVLCPTTAGGPYVVDVSADPNFGTPTLDPATGRVTWPDGFSKVFPLPTGCQAPTPPPVTPPPPPVVPPTPPPPPVPPRPIPPLKATKTVRVIRAVACRAAGDRSYAVVRVRVVWKRAGVVVKTKQRTYRRYGHVCVIPPVAG